MRTLLGAGWVVAMVPSEGAWAARAAQRVEPSEALGYASPIHLHSRERTETAEQTARFLEQASRKWVSALAGRALGFLSRLAAAQASPTFPQDLFVRLGRSAPVPWAQWEPWV